jgi:D-glycero-beta-D-manno-heptose-7-phosphate kinase
MAELLQSVRPRPKALLKWLERLPKVHVGVLGDFAADHYLLGTTARISREAPVLILKKREDSVRPGQAGNSAANLAALGVQCTAFGVVGDDAQGDALLSALELQGIRTSGIIASPDVRTIVKTRVLAGGHHAALQQVIRLDDDEGLTITGTIREDLHERLAEALPELDALLISDYGYSTVDAATWKLVSSRQRRGKGKSRGPVLRILDSRHGLMKLTGADVITPNETEVYDHLGIVRYDGADPVPAGARLMKAAKCRGMIMTRGNEGMLVFADRGRPTHIPIHGSDEVTDVTGAGDTVAAVVAAVSAAGAELRVAAELANVAAGLAVMKRGAATVSPDEIRAALG